MLCNSNTKYLNVFFVARPRKSSDKVPLTPGPDSASRTTVRSRSRLNSSGGGGVSLSQPGSRSTSPTSLKAYHTYLDSPGLAPSTVRLQKAESSPVRLLVRTEVDFLSLVFNQLQLIFRNA